MRGDLRPSCCPRCWWPHAGAPCRRRLQRPVQPSGRALQLRASPSAVSGTAGRVNRWSTPTAIPPAEPAGWVEAGKLPLVPYDLTVVPLADGGAIAIGSDWTDDSSHPAAFRWTPGTTKWKEIEPLNKMRSRFGATLLRDGRVLVAGGVNDAGQSFSSAYVFDPERPSAGWSKVGLLDTARTAPSIAALPDGRVLVAGGYFRRESAGLASPMRGFASPRGTPPWEITPARRGALDIDVPPYGYALATAELFDPDTGEWTPTGSLNYARAGAPAVTLSDGRVLIAGTGDDVLEDVAPEAWTTAEIYDPASGTFALAGSLPALDQNRLRELGVDLRDSYLDPGHPGQLVALPDGGALLVGRNHWAKHRCGRAAVHPIRPGARDVAGDRCALRRRRLQRSPKGCTGRLRRASSAGSSQGWMAAVCCRPDAGLPRSSPQSQDRRQSMTRPPTPGSSSHRCPMSTVPAWRWASRMGRHWSSGVGGTVTRPTPFASCRRASHAARSRYDGSSVPKWRNRQTRRSQTPLRATAVLAGHKVSFRTQSSRASDKRRSQASH